MSSDKPVLLSGGNPQIPKGYGDAPVQAYIAAMPGWKRDVGRRLDALVEATVPGVKKAVKWNSPLYGVEEGTWFLGFHCFNRYVKVTFMRGAALKPPPPGRLPRTRPGSSTVPGRPSTPATSTPSRTKPSSSCSWPE